MGDVIILVMWCRLGAKEECPPATLALALPKST